MSKMYLEVINSKFINGTSMRDESTEYVEFDLGFDIPEKFGNLENLQTAEKNILEIIKKYSEEADVMLGIRYNNAMVGTDYHKLQKYSRRLFVELSEGYYRLVMIEYFPYGNDNHSLNWFAIRNYYEKKNNGFIIKRA